MKPFLLVLARLLALPLVLLIGLLIVCLMAWDWLRAGIWFGEE